MDLNQNDCIETKRKCALYEQWNKKKLLQKGSIGQNGIHILIFYEIR